MKKRVGIEGKSNSKIALAKTSSERKHKSDSIDGHKSDSIEETEKKRRMNSVGLTRLHSINNVHQLVNDWYAYAASCFNLGPEHASETVSNSLTDMIGAGRMYDHVFDERRRRNLSIENESNRYF